MKSGARSLRGHETVVVVAEHAPSRGAVARLLKRLGDDETQRIDPASPHVAIDIACDALQDASLVENVVVRQGVDRHVITDATIYRIVARATEDGFGGV